MKSEMTNTFALIGASKTGTALAYHLEKAGFLPTFLWNRGVAGIERTIKYVRFQQSTAELTAFPQDIEWIIIAVSDDAIPTVTRDLSKVLKTGTGKRVFHISGAWDSALLMDLEKKDCRTGSFHPLLSAPDIDTGIAMMGDAVFSCEGEIAQDLKQLAEIIGGTGIVLNAEQKSLVHLSAVFVNNFQTVTIQALKQLAESKDISSSQLALLLKTVSQQAIDNAWTKPLNESLTGPIVRGDQRTINQHQDQLRDAPELGKLYKQYVALTRQLLKTELE